MEHAAALEAPPAVTSRGPDELDRMLAYPKTDDPHYADAVSAALQALQVAEEGGAEALGRRLIRLIDGRRLAQLIRSDGGCAEACAVERLLALGYPWALHLTPEQLERARRRAPRPRPSGLAWGASAAAVALAGLEACCCFASGPALSLLPGFTMLVAAIGANVLYVAGATSRRPLALYSGLVLAGCAALIGTFGTALTGGDCAIFAAGLSPFWLSLAATVLPGAARR